MRYLILSRSFLMPSARALSARLSELDGRNTYSARSAISENLIPRKVVRWGNSDPLPREFEDLNINAPEHIRTAAHKGRLSSLLKEAGVPCIEFCRDDPSAYPVAVRSTMTGMGGNGIHVCTSEEEFAHYRGQTWSPWYPFSYELGVHVINGVVVKVMKKVAPDGTPLEQYPIRNQARGYEFSRVSPSSFSKLGASVSAFLSAFPVKAGRLDIGWDSRDRVYRVIEFNSAPGLTHNNDTLDMYARGILEMIT